MEKIWQFVYAVAQATGLTATQVLALAVLLALALIWLGIEVNARSQRVNLSSHEARVRSGLYADARTARRPDRR